MGFGILIVGDLCKMTKELILNTHTIVADRMRHVVNILDLDSIEVICDIGSWHLGQSIEFLELFPDATVHAFEPNPENYQNCVDIHSRLSGFFKKNLKLYQYALDASPGTINFYPVVDTNPGASSKYKFMEGLNGSFLDEEWNQKEIQVQATTLDIWKSQNNIDKVDIIWIDVQGGELDVFEGGKETLKDVKCIFTEVGLKPYYEGQSLRTEIDNFLCNECDFIELKDAFELNGSEYEANAIYVKKDLVDGKS